jgi:hypothetical protein
MNRLFSILRDNLKEMYGKQKRLKELIYKMDDQK